MIRGLIISVFFSPVLCFAQLNSDGNAVKEKFPAMYSYFKARGEKEWKDDYSMIAHEINTQSEAFLSIFNLAAKDQLDRPVFIKSLQKWIDDSEIDYNSKIMALMKQKSEMKDKIITVLMCKADYRMIKYEYDKQLKAKQDL